MKAERPEFEEPLGARFESDNLSGRDETDIRVGIHLCYDRYGGTPYWMGL